MTIHPKYTIGLIWNGKKYIIDKHEDSHQEYSTTQLIKHAYRNRTQIPRKP